MVRSYRMILLGLMLPACVSTQSTITVDNKICDPLFDERISFSALPILLYSDQHGSYATPAQCPERAFTVDYSQTEIVRNPRSKIARQMRIDSAFGGLPVRMIIAGYFHPKDGDEHRSKIVVQQIVSYVKTTNPHVPVRDDN